MRLPAVLFALITPPQAPRLPRKLSGTLQKIKETRKVTLGYQEASVPFSYLDDNQRARSALRSTSVSRLSMP